MIRTSSALVFVLTACSSGPAPAQNGQAPIRGAQSAVAKPFTAAPVAKFNAPWAMTFLPDGRMLVTEKAGQLLLVSADGKQRAAVAGIPSVDSAGQGGLMDIVLHPDFANRDQGATNNRRIYFSYSEARDGGKGVVLASGRLLDMDGGPQLDGFRILYRATPYVSGNGHYSGRIAFAPDGKLFFTVGERQKFTPAQDKSGTLGKVLRLNDDGTPAAGNPLAAQGFRPEVWSYGHRNLLGIAFDNKGRLWEQEMGPEGGDEVNIIVPAKNYGYPIVSNGRNYGASTDDIPDHSTRPEFEAPKVSWNPVISPAGLIVYSGAMFPAWKGNLFIGGLSSEALIRVSVDGDTAKEAERFKMGARIREVEQGPDGAIWILEDKGRLLKLTPKP